MKSEDKILVLGVTGMLGHVLFRELNHLGYNVVGTARDVSRFTSFFSKEEMNRIRSGVDATDFDTITRTFAAVQPDFVVNCIGIVKQLPISKDPLISITLNSQLPHRISMLARTSKAKFIQISTDCVFNGKKGDYTESDPSDAEDLYGRTKFLGEVDYPHCITLRTSIVGNEILTSRSLIDWFLSQNSPVDGFVNALYSGLTTLEMVNVIEHIMTDCVQLSGVYHVSSEYISKYDLLNLCRRHFSHNIEIKKNTEYVLDRTLNSDRFRKESGYRIPDWDSMIRDLADYYFKTDYLKYKDSYDQQSNG